MLRLITNTTKFKLSEHATKTISHLTRTRIHTTQSSKAISPFIYLAIRPVVKLVLVPVAGRAIRNWYAKLPDTKKHSIRSKILSNPKNLLVAAIGYFSAVGAIYAFNNEVTPITARRRFKCFSSEQYEHVSKFQFEYMLRKFDTLLLDDGSEKCRRVKGICSKILAANESVFPQIKDRNWTVTVVDLPLKNAMVLADGQILVFRGMIDFCKSDDELGFILCHEISHALLAHGAELMSHSQLVDSLVLPVVAPIWIMSPSILAAAFFHLLIFQLSNIAFNLPHSRKLEKEADEVGLIMAARACFDVRYSVSFWRRFDLHQKTEIGLPPSAETPRFMKNFSTHPANADRGNYLEKLLANANDVRDTCACEHLSSHDPREEIAQEANRLQNKYDERKRKTVIAIK